MRTRSSPSRERASGDRDGDTSTSIRSHPADELRRRHGNRAIGRAIEARREDEQEEAPTKTGLAPEGSGGRRLPPALRREMERAFDADFRDVRVHDAPAGTASASVLAADAATDGTDIVAARRLSNPGTPGDRLLLAHELAHVAQYRGRNVAERTGRHRADSAEREATQAAVAVAAGGTARVSETPPGDVATGVLDWLEEKAQGATSAVGNAVSSTWGATKRGASAAWNTAESGVSAASNAASRVYGGMQSASNWIREAGSGLEKDIDWAQDKYAQGAGWVADQAEGIPGLEQAADAGAFLVDQGSQLFAGGLQFGVTTGTDLASMVANPVDTVRGIGSLAMANPFVGMPVRLGRAARQSVFQGVDPATAFGRAVDPRAILREQTQLGRGMYQAFKEEYARSVGEDGDYLQAVGRGLGELVTTVGTGGMLGVGTKAGKLSKLSKVSRATDTASDAAKGAKTASSASSGPVPYAGGRLSGRVDAPGGSRIAVSGRDGAPGKGTITTAADETMTLDEAMNLAERAMRGEPIPFKGKMVSRSGGAWRDEAGQFAEDPSSLWRAGPKGGSQSSHGSAPAPGSAVSPPPNSPGFVQAQLGKNWPYDVSPPKGLGSLVQRDHPIQIEVAKRQRTAPDGTVYYDRSFSRKQGELTVLEESSSGKPHAVKSAIERERMLGAFPDELTSEGAIIQRAREIIDEVRSKTGGYSDQSAVDRGILSHQAAKHASGPDVDVPAGAPRSLRQTREEMVRHLGTSDEIESAIDELLRALEAGEL